MPVYEYYCDKCDAKWRSPCRFANTTKGRSSAPSVAAKLCDRCWAPSCLRPRRNP